MKLSDLDPSDVEPAKLKLSDLHPDDVVPSESISKTPVADRIADFASKYTPLALTPFSSEHTADKIADIASHAPLVGGLAKPALETFSDASKAALNGASLGWKDEIIGAAKAAGKTGLEALTGELPQNKNQGYAGALPDTYEELLNNYKKYKGQEQEDLKAAEQRSPTATKLAEFGGSFLPYGAAFKAAKLAPIAEGATPEAINALKKLQLIRNAKVGGALGGAQGLGESEGSGKQLAKDAAISTALGALGTTTAEKWVAPFVEGHVNNFVEYLKDQPWAKQLAATVQNKLAGGSLFGEKGSAGINNLSSDKSLNIKNALTDNVDQQLKKMDEMFKQGGEQRLSPDTQHLETISNAETGLNKLFPGAFEKEFEALKTGQMTPKDANKFRTELKDQINNLYNTGKINADPRYKQLAADLKGVTPENLEHQMQFNLGNADQNNQMSLNLNDNNQGNLQNKTPNMISALEEMSNKAGTDIKQANKNIQQSREAIDPFMQRAGRIIDTATGKAPENWSSDSSVASQGQKIIDTLNRISNNAGRTDKNAIGARKSLADLQNILQKVKEANPNLNVDPTKLATDMQNQAWLNGAQQSVDGLTQKTSNILTKADVIGRFRSAEYASKLPVVQKLSKILLEDSPEARQALARAQYANPKIAPIAKEYTDALTDKNPSTLNNVVFKMMQMPDVKKALWPDEEDENSGTP